MGSNFIKRFGISRKWIISLMGMYACGLMYVLRAGASVAMVRMVDNSTVGHTNAPVFDWSPTLQGIILGAIFYLYWLVPTIVGSFCERFGGKRLAMVGIFFPCILTSIAPWAATIHYAFLIAIQCLIGVFQSFIYPAFFHLYVQWFPPEERSRANSGIQVGQAFGGATIYLIGGYLCETKVGWPMVFYAVAALHVPWILLWLYFGGDHPPDMQVKPINYRLKELQPDKPSVPWLAISLSPAVWASILSKFACSYGFYMFLSKLPAYLDSVYGIGIVQNGFINAATYMSYGVACIVAPFLSNLMIERTNISPLMVRKIFQGISMLVPAFCLITITFIDHQQYVVIALLILAMFGYGFVTGGEWTMISEYAPNFVGTLAGFTSTLGFTTGILAPYFVGLILDSDIGSLRFKWNVSFYMASAFYILCYLAFWFMSTVQQQEWDKIPN